jgi:hypothetical protein
MRNKELIVAEVRIVVKPADDAEALPISCAVRVEAGCFWSAELLRVINAPSALDVSALGAVPDFMDWSCEP